MGWSFMQRQKGISDKDFFQKELREGLKILDCATVKSVFYAAVQDGENIWAFTAQIKRVKDYLNFGYKAEGEEVGAYTCDCPERILDLLTPPCNEWAQQWRDQCRANIALQKTKLKITKGLKFRTPQPVKFTDGSHYQEFEVVDPKKLLMRPLIEPYYHVTIRRERLLGAVVL